MQGEHKRFCNYSCVKLAASKNVAKGWRVVTLALPRMSEERKPSRWERMRLNLVVPIGVVVAVAVICVVVAVLTSAHRADEVSLDREQQLVQRAIAARGERILREVESVAATDRATLAIRTDYDPQWVERSIGAWLPTCCSVEAVRSSTQ